MRLLKNTEVRPPYLNPGSLWERGTNENTNGLIRQYFPKGTEFDKVSVREIKRVQRQLNNRPRAVLGYMKPDEVIKNSFLTIGTKYGGTTSIFSNIFLKL